MTKHMPILSVAILAVIIAFFISIPKNKKHIFEKKDVFDGVDVRVEFNSVAEKELMGEQYSFVYFQYIIENRQPQKISFHPGKIKVKYNGLKNNSVGYDSLASAMTEAVALPTGTSEYALYFVFKQPNVGRDVTDFSILDAGMVFGAGDDLHQG